VGTITRGYRVQVTLHTFKDQMVFARSDSQPAELSPPMLLPNAIPLDQCTGLLMLAACVLPSARTALLRGRFSL